MSLIDRHRQKILFSILFAIFVYAILLVVSDSQKLAVVVSRFEWKLVPIILAFSLFNYALRFLKWHYYLHLVEVRNLPWLDSLLIFLSGFVMTLTPGKAGEWLKSFLVRQRVGAPVALTAPIVLAERMTDGLAMLLLAGAGLLIFDNWLVRVFVALVLMSASAAVLLVQNRRAARVVGDRLQGFQVPSGWIEHLRAFYNSSYRLLGPRSLAFAIGLGFVSWSGECIALALVLYGLGVPLSFTLVVLSAFAMGFATLAGSVLLMPGGLGVMEGSIDGMLVAFGRPPWLPGVAVITQPVGAAATLIIRFATLWVGVSIGFLALFLVQRRFGRRSQLAAPELETPA